MTPPKTRVLVIDDEPQILRALRINLSVRGYEVATAATGARRTALGRRPPAGRRSFSTSACRTCPASRCSRVFAGGLPRL